jgi:predicted nuclease with TOPRIM domain
MKELSATVETLEEQKSKYENDLKTSIDKIYDLREIIAELEAQVAAKALSEKFLKLLTDTQSIGFV